MTTHTLTQFERDLTVSALASIMAQTAHQLANNNTNLKSRASQRQVAIDAERLAPRLFDKTTELKLRIDASDSKFEPLAKSE